MPGSDGSSGCIVGVEGVSESRYVIIVDECVPPGLAERIARELKHRVADVIAVIRTRWQGFRDQKLAKRIWRKICEKAGKVVIFITTDRRFRKSAKLDKLDRGQRKFRLLPVKKLQITLMDVEGSVGAQIVGDVKTRLSEFEATLAA